MSHYNSLSVSQVRAVFGQMHQLQSPPSNVASSPSSATSSGQFVAVGGSHRATSPLSHATMRQSSHQKNASTSTSGIIVSPPAHGGSSGGTNPFTRYSHATMLPHMNELKQHIPASDATDDKPDAPRIYAGMTNGKVGRENARKTFWHSVIGRRHIHRNTLSPHAYIGVDGRMDSNRENELHHMLRTCLLTLFSTSVPLSFLPASMPVRPSTQSLDPEELDPELVEQIDMELESGYFSNFSPALTSSDFSTLRRVLQLELLWSGRESYLNGSAHLAARMLLLLDRDEAATLDLLSVACHQLHSYFSPPPASLPQSSPPLRTESLLLSELLQSSAQGSQLLDHLEEELGFDQVDLGDLMSTWMSGAFCQVFPLELCARAIDLLVWPQGGAPLLVGVVLGLMLVSSLQILQCTSGEALYSFLHDLPSTLTKAQTSEAFTHAYFHFQLPHAQGTLDLLRRELDWNKVLHQAAGGPLVFSNVTAILAGKGVGAAATAAQAASAAAAANNSAAGSTVAAFGAGTGAGAGTPSNSNTLNFNAQRSSRGLSMPSIPTPTSTSSASNASNAGRTHHNDPSFDLTSYQAEAAAARRSMAMGDGAAAAYAQHRKGNASSSQQLLSASAPVQSSAASSLPSAAAAAASPPTIDPKLLADLDAATSSSSSSSSRSTPTPQSMQALLERALKELRTMEQYVKGAKREGEAAAAANSGSSSSSSGATGFDALSDAGAHARAVTASVSSVSSTQVPALTERGVPLLPGELTKKVVPPNGFIRYSELLEYQPFPTLSMQGYLMKSRAPSKLFRRRGSSGFFGNLHRRFFVLTGHFLVYFKSHHDPKPTRDESVLDLRTAVASKIKNHEFAPFAFQITQKEKGNLLFLLFADNETVREVWLECLAHATQVPLPNAST